MKDCAPKAARSLVVFGAAASGTGASNDFDNLSFAVHIQI
jgi:hypothetical protein